MSINELNPSNPFPHHHVPIVNLSDTELLQAATYQNRGAILGPVVLFAHENKEENVQLVKENFQLAFSHQQDHHSRIRNRPVLEHMQSQDCFVLKYKSNTLTQTEMVRFLMTPYCKNLLTIISSRPPWT